MSGEAAAAAIFDDAAAFGSACSGALFGLDLGEKTIGVAVCDPSRLIASPVETIRRGRFRDDAARLVALADGRAAGGWVLGLPLNLDGTAGPRVQATRAFARNLAAIDRRPILLWDERLSTAAVERMLIAGDMSRKRRAEVVDRSAAAYILQGALDRLRQAGA